jgi:hypothetical protein
MSDETKSDDIRIADALMLAAGQHRTLDISQAHEMVARARELLCPPVTETTEEQDARALCRAFDAAMPCDGDGPMWLAMARYMRTRIASAVASERAKASAPKLPDVDALAKELEESFPRGGELKRGEAMNIAAHLVEFVRLSLAAPPAPPAPTLPDVDAARCWMPNCDGSCHRAPPAKVEPAPGATVSGPPNVGQPVDIQTAPHEWTRDAVLSVKADADGAVWLRTLGGYVCRADWEGRSWRRVASAASRAAKTETKGEP